jgi:hypothetical protein
MEEIEAHDWGIGPHMPDDERRQRSISAYWLPAWYAKVQDLTFNTTFWQELPEHFAPSMVRWEHKSPKDSEHWGPVQSRAEAEHLFYTSLRCKTNPGSIYCLRAWHELVAEWRCFWSGGLVAISGDEAPQALVDYVQSIASRIPYYRCVLDVAVDHENKYWLVEFNSWETNSGAHLFEWSEIEDTVPVECRWAKFSRHLPWPLASTLPKAPRSSILLDQVQLLRPHAPSCWLIKENVYVCNDVWLAQLDANLYPVRWRRGPFRFAKLEATAQGLRAGDQYYWDDLTPAKPSAVLPLEGDAYPEPPYRYGAVGLCRGTYVFCRFIEELVAVPF